MSAVLGNAQVLKNRNLDEVEEEEEKRRRQELRSEDRHWQRRHFDTAICQQRDEQHIRRRGHHEPFSWTYSPNVLSVTHSICDCLTAVDDGDDTQRAKVIDVEV